MLTVGITGGIGSGKSAAADRFAELGVPVIDADVIARQIVEPGRPACSKVIETFGAEFAAADGGLDRGKLRKLVFSDSGKITRLEDILHPEIHAEILRRLSDLSAPYAVVVIPLLAESKRSYPLDRVLVIDAPSQLQISRVSDRDGETAQEVEKIISLQATRKDRLRVADDVISNTGTRQSLTSAVDELHSKYLAIAEDMGC
ncbi:MAG: dephospho-CoA kinase [Acidiferrobacterales bacterium]|nr:dephospho-CoA kinase [Acidiferrobacterales bacterium]